MARLSASLVNKFWVRTRTYEYELVEYSIDFFGTMALLCQESRSDARLAFAGIDLVRMHTSWAHTHIYIYIFIYT